MRDSVILLGFLEGVATGFAVLNTWDENVELFFA
jgi:hypothetical protein